MILALMLVTLVLPVFPQDDPRQTTGDTSEVSDDIADLMAKAEQGDAWSQYFLGVLYEVGKSVPKDDKEAARWYLAAAEQGNVSAQFELGVMYENGRGVPQDYEDAAKWYRAAAEQGHLSAQFNLWFHLCEGVGRPSALEGSCTVVSGPGRAGVCVCPDLMEKTS
jgi:TPR repeat protein